MTRLMRPWTIQYTLGMVCLANVKTSLNARGGPGTNYDIVTTLPKGTAIDDTAKEGVWWHCELEEGEQVWLHPFSL